MELCFPIRENKGLASAVYGHFASAPLLLLVDTSTRECRAIDNCDPSKPHAGCNPFMALQGISLKGIVVDGAGEESVLIMNMAGHRMFQASATLVADNVEFFEAGRLDELSVSNESHERCDSTGGHSCTHSPAIPGGHPQ